MMKKLLAYLLLAGVAYAAPRPNIVLIMVDDMGYSDLGCYGAEIQTPNIDALASSGIRFREFYNTAKCYTSRACLVSGVYAHQNGFADTNDSHLKNSVTLGEVLRAAGYHTYAAGKHHSLDNLYDRGFDHYYGLRDGACNHFNPGLQRTGEQEPARKTSFNRVWADDSLVFQARDPAYQDYFPALASTNPAPFYSTDAFTAKAQEYLTEWESQNTGNPFFLYLPYTAPHDPIMAWPDDIAKYDGVYDVGYDTIRTNRYQKQLDMGLLNASQHPLSPSTYHQDWDSIDQTEKDKEIRRMQVYAAMVDRVDQKIGDLITQLQQMGVYDDTLILFCSDNGASPGIKDTLTNPAAEIGDLDRYTAQGQSWANVNDTPFREYKTDPEEGGIRTPLIAHWPNGIVNTNRFTDKSGHLIDFMATFVELAGADYPRFYDGKGVTPMQGESFTDVLYDQMVTPHSPLYFEYSQGRVVRDGDYKLISGNSGSTWKLFDMSTDATELNDLSASLPSIKADLIAKFNTWFTAVNGNDLPTAYDDLVLVPTNSGPISINVLSNDADSDGTIDASTLVITRAPTNGTAVILPDDTIRYTATGDGTADEFFYQVRDNDGEVSNEGRVAMRSPDPSDTTPPAAPVGLSAASGSSLLDWTDNTEPDLGGYKIKRSAISGGPYLDVGQSAASDYVDNSFDHAGTYYYVVTAVDINGNESSSSAEVTAPSTFQAEEATVVGPEIKSGESGYTGTGYADYKNASGDYIEWTVASASGGDYDIAFRYALESGDRALEIKVNGVVVASSLSFPGTGDWSTWGTTAPLSVTLNAGSNTIRATAIGTSGGNVDSLVVNGNAASTVTSPRVLWGMAGAVGDSQTPENGNTTTFSATHVSGPDGNAYGSSANGLDAAAFDVNGASDINPVDGTDDTWYIRHKQSTKSTTVNYAAGYTEFTISADPGYVLNLTSLDFDSARGGTGGIRGFAVYGAPNAVPTTSDSLLLVTNEATTVTRDTPLTRSIVLSGAEYQGINSITFRYYPLADATGSTIEFTNMELNGIVSPTGSTIPTGYDLWMKYSMVGDAVLLNQYRLDASEIVVQGSSDTLTAIRDELNAALDGLLGQDVPAAGLVTQDGAVVAGTPASSSIIAALGWGAELAALGEEGYLIRSAVVDGKNVAVIASEGEVGALYGSFHFLRLIQTGQSLASLDLSESPKIKTRMLNHWDWDKYGDELLVERGYAGNSIWKWSELPGTVDSRYTDYARANASIGINGTVLNNVNAQVEILTPEYLAKVAALADVFRPYGIKVYLTARYDAPEALSSLTTSDPRIPAVRDWWDAKVAEIYGLIPDFVGFLVKADSEGNPGPNTYGMNHAEGANPLADALAPYGGVVIWRAFVYDSSIDADRVRRPYKQFEPLDGDFRTNVILQAKNGPFDFQPREPYHPLFGAMSQTTLGMEFQITQEYLGHSTHLVYLAPMWKEVLDSDTYANGAGSTVAKVVDGSLHGYNTSMIAGVANIGSDINWCGHHFAQANWYAYGRLAWDYDLTSEGIADEWIRMTWSNDAEVRTELAGMMMPSWEAAVNYMTPLGLAFTVDGNTYDPAHYHPNPSARNGKYWFADSAQFS